MMYIGEKTNHQTNNVYYNYTILYPRFITCITVQSNIWEMKVCWYHCSLESWEILGTWLFKTKTSSGQKLPLWTGLIWHHHHQSCRHEDPCYQDPSHESGHVCWFQPSKISWGDFLSSQLMEKIMHHLWCRISCDGENLGQLNFMNSINPIPWISFLGIENEDF